MQLVIGKEANHELTADRKSAPYLALDVSLPVLFWNISPKQGRHKLHNSLNMSHIWQWISFLKYRLIERGLIALCSISIPVLYNISSQYVPLKSEIKESCPIFVILATKGVKDPWFLFEKLQKFHLDEFILRYQDILMSNRLHRNPQTLLIQQTAG